MKRTPLHLALLSSALLLASPLALGGELDVSPTANLQYDFVRFDSDDVRLRDDKAFRRARLGFKLKGDAWQFVAEHDLADRTPPDAYVEWTPAKGHSLRIGQFKQPFLLEDAESGWESILALNPSARVALSSALHDLVGKRLGIPVYKLWGLDPAKAPRSTFTIGIDNDAKLRQKVKASYDEQTDIRYAAARLWVDAIIPPERTRDALLVALDVATRYDDGREFKTGVLQV